MRRFWGLLFILIILSCDNDRGIRNPNLQDLGFRFELNLNLPLYIPLTNPGSSVYVGANGVGNRGVFVINTGFDLFRAFEASCPNHPPNDCSTMTADGQIVVCACEDFEYFLINGLQKSPPDDGQRYYNMLEYRAVFNGGVVTISN